MPSKQPIQRPADIAENIQAIAEFTAGMRYEDYIHDRRTIYAVTRALEIISEAFEFVVATPDAVQTRTYRLHRQQGDGRLKRRWDNAPHHRDVSTFPHHVHVGPIDQVESATPMTIRQALAYIEEALQRDDSLSQG